MPARVLERQIAVGNKVKSYAGGIAAGNGDLVSRAEHIVEQGEHPKIQRGGDRAHQREPPKCRYVRYQALHPDEMRLRNTPVQRIPAGYRTDSRSASSV